MRKKILFIFCLISFSGFLFGQSLSLSDDNGAIANGATITHEIDPYESFYAHIYVTNNSATSVPVLVKKVELSVLSGTENTFCWVQCYNTTTTISPDYINLSPGQTTTAFYGDYSPLGYEGVTTIRYVFFNDNNWDDSTYVTVNYNTLTFKVKENIEKPKEFSLVCQPNPANNYTNLNYSFLDTDKEKTFVLRNLVGGEVYRFKLSDIQGKLYIPLGNLKEGVYCYTLYEAENAILTKKLVIKR